MFHSLKLPLTFNAKILQNELALLQPEEWISHFVKQNYEGIWSIIPLRCAATAKHPVMMVYSDPTCTEFVNTPFLERLPYHSKVLESFKCPLESVRLMKLSAGSTIKEHSDLDLNIEEGTVRLHIPVITNSKVDFRLNKVRIRLNEGECWYLRLSDPHSVKNNGLQDRIHLVIDAKVNNWLSKLLAGKK